jgi:hypothetical protein
VLVAVVAVVLLAGLGVLLVRRGGDDGTTITAGDADGSGRSADAAAPTTTVATTTTSPTTTAAVTTAPPATTAPKPTTAPAPTTTAAPRGPAFDITPTSGPAGTRVTASGGGCQGESYGAGIYIHDPSGQGVDGDGTSTQPDGTWRLEFAMGNYSGPGKYTIRAVCMDASSKVVFEYAPRTFTVT